MDFNKDWEKEDNDLLRKLIKENKSPDEIVSIIGFEKLEKNPKKKYVGKFSDFILNEITSIPKKTLYTLKQDESTSFKGNLNYHAFFRTDSGVEYVLDLIYVEDIMSPYKNKSMFNISFTTKEQYDSTSATKYEKETNKNEHLELMSRLIYIIEDINIYLTSKYGEIVYIIGETSNPKKINMYRDIIKNSLNYNELKGKSSIILGRDVYYYTKKKINNEHN
jgi:hypothetical protein